MTLHTKKELRQQDPVTVGSAAMVGTAIGAMGGGWGGAFIGFLIGSAIDSENERRKRESNFR